MSARPAAALVLALLAAAPLAAQEGEAPAELSLERAVELAREHSPSIRIQRNDLDVSRAAVRTASGDFLPTVSANLGFGYTASGERRAGSVLLAEQPSVLSSSYSLGASYQISAPRLLQPGVARGELRATEARVSGEEAALAGEVTQRYLAVLQAAEQVELAGREIERAEAHARSARDRMEAGSVLALEVQRAEVQRGRARVRRVRAENAHAAAVGALSRTLGVRVAPGARLVSRFSLFEPRWETAALVGRARANNASLRSARAGAGAAETRVRVARAGYLPTVTLGLSLNGWKQRFDEDALVRQRVGANAPDSVVERVRGEVRAQNSGFPFGYNRQPWAATLNVALPVFGGFSRGQQVRQARAAAEDARLQLRAEEQRVADEVETALLELASARQAAAVAAEVRAAATEEVEMADERFRLGVANSLAVLDAQQHLAEAEQEQSAAAFDFHRALAKLEMLVGERLR